MGAITTDTAGRNSCMHMELTLPETNIRDVGSSLHQTKNIRTDRWVSPMKSRLDSGLQEWYFLVHMDGEVFSPELTVYLLALRQVYHF